MNQKQDLIFLYWLFISPILPILIPFSDSGGIVREELY
jgi:hypothetical protein